MPTRYPRFTTSPPPPASSWQDLSTAQKDLWKDFAIGTPAAWLDFQTRGRTGQELYANYAYILSALNDDPTSPTTLPATATWQDRIIRSTGWTATDAPSIVGVIWRTPAADTNFLYFMTPPAAVASDLDTSSVAYIGFETVGEGAAPDDPTKDFGAEYEAIHGDLAAHVGEFILGFSFQINGAQARFDFAFLLEITAA